MQILILGASSRIGTALSRAFSSGNRLVLCGRDSARLGAAVIECQGAGATSAMPVVMDLCAGAGPILSAIAGQNIDLVIDAASGASGTRDAEIAAEGLADLVRADFLSRIDLFEALLKRQPAAPAVIYISSVLALVRSPDRFVYTALKQLNQLYLEKLRPAGSDGSLLIVYVGKVIETKAATTEPAALAAAVHEAYLDKRAKLFHGLSGRLLVTLYYAQPLVFHGVTWLQRRLRKLIRG